MERLGHERLSAADVAHEENRRTRRRDARQRRLEIRQRQGGADEERERIVQPGPRGEPAAPRRRARRRPPRSARRARSRRRPPRAPTKSRSAGSETVSAGTRRRPTLSPAGRGTGKTRSARARFEDLPAARLSRERPTRLRAERRGSVPFQSAAIASPSFGGSRETNARLWTGVDRRDVGRDLLKQLLEGNRPVEALEESRPRISRGPLLRPGAAPRRGPRRDAGPEPWPAAPATATGACRRRQAREPVRGATSAAVASERASRPRGGGAAIRFGFGAGPFRSVIVASPMAIRSPAARAAVLTIEPFRVTSEPGRAPEDLEAKLLARHGDPGVPAEYTAGAHNEIIARRSANVDDIPMDLANFRFAARLADFKAQHGTDPPPLGDSFLYRHEPITRSGVVRPSSTQIERPAAAGPGAHRIRGRAERHTCRFPRSTGRPSGGATPRR